MCCIEGLTTFRYWRFDHCAVMKIDHCAILKVWTVCLFKGLTTVLYWRFDHFAVLKVWPLCCIEGLATVLCWSFDHCAVLKLVKVSYLQRSVKTLCLNNSSVREERQKPAKSSYKYTRRKTGIKTPIIPDQIRTNNSLHFSRLQFKPEPFSLMFFCWFFTRQTLIEVLTWNISYSEN